MPFPAPLRVGVAGVFLVRRQDSGLLRIIGVTMIGFYAGDIAPEFQYKNGYRDQDRAGDLS